MPENREGEEIRLAIADEPLLLKPTDDLDELADTAPMDRDLLPLLDVVVHEREYPYAKRRALLAPQAPFPTDHIATGNPFDIEDWADRAYGKPWVRVQDRATHVYALRVGASSLPVDDRVLLGRTLNGELALIHVTEIGQLL